MKNLYLELLIQAKENFKKGEHISEKGFKGYSQNESVFILGEDCWIGDVLMLDKKDGLMKIAKLHNQALDLT